MSDLEGKVALLTGAASGIGRHFAEHLAQAGAAVLIADLHGVAAAAAGLRAAGLAAEAIDGDVSSEADAGAMVQAAESRFGGLDILVNNAALFSALRPGPLPTSRPTSGAA